MPRQTINQITVTSSLTGADASYPADQAPAEVKVTVAGKSANLDLHPAELEALTALVNGDSTPLRELFTPVKRAGSNGGKSANPLLAEIREWAHANKIEGPDGPVGDKGRIPADVTEKFYVAHPDKRPANPEAAPAT